MEKQEFKKYMHIERFGTPETEGIDNGMCYIFPKIDGTNAQLWMDGGLKAGSRNRELSVDNDNAGFYNWALSQLPILNFFHSNPNLRLYGEWLVPHSLKTYNDNAWRQFYVFDVMDDENYLSYETYKPMLEEFGIEYIPPICKVNNPSYELIVSQLDKNGYLIKDGSGVGEGIVVKNYDYKNKFGRVVWGKIVTNEFKAKHSKCQITELNGSTLIEETICNRYVTKALAEKEYAKIITESEGWNPKYIPRLLNTVYYCLVTEECWNFVKEFKNPTVDFKRLQFFCTQRVKELLPNVF